MQNEIDVLKTAHNELLSSLGKRDYLTRTDFVGSLTNEKLIKEFKEIDEPVYPCTYDWAMNIAHDYDYMKNQILNFNFRYLDNFYNKLKELEQKQLDIDNYAK